ncbi:hypothetical protein [Myxococcus xanthus]|uniref:Lipoprotein n=1 Tax=Myxococcus xanthus TaxID=34 RepID=A0AAE6KQU2_MYXXA|nr:hypothetical protein [Myxococcus xanthus]QDE66444.1 hypothetical protein BHS09_05185 [Myxococcus xanthus]QDE73717.1 hypothetical protein BHS08_05190 [Myxococcus xanthus]QDE80977.1 hypothetical protein BHS07_05060 [Myxococcus xanthus]
MRIHPRASASAVLSLLSLVVLGACGEDRSLPLDKPEPAPFQPVQVPAITALAPVSAFADQAGGGVFATASRELVRLRLDGTYGALEPHPDNEVAAGGILGVFRLGPHSALVETQNGLFMAESGWLIAPPWRDALGQGVIATAQSADGAVWLAHTRGLFRLQEGTLAELKVDGASVKAITSLAAAPSPENLPGVWFLHDGGLSVAVALRTTHYRVHTTSAPLAEGESLQALAGIGPAVGTSGELWALTNQALLRRGRDGWRRVELPQQPQKLIASGRFLWAKTGGSLLQYDADANVWRAATDVGAGDFHFLAADESGSVWVQQGGVSAALSHVLVPRLRGLYQGMQLVNDGLVVRAVMPPGGAPERVVYKLGNSEIPTEGPDYSLGGLEADGTHRAYSFASLEAGRYVLSVVARYSDGSEAQRSVPFDYAPLASGPLSWDKDIRPIHEARCRNCHNNASAARSLDSYELWRANAPIITAAVRDQRMPADGPMDPELISRIQRWASSGARP